MSSAASESRRFVGKYRILERIATGGMGVVYKAMDTDNDREVALKVLSPDLASNPKMRERFRREAKHGKKLSHENIVALYEFSEDQGTFFLAMEYVQGLNLLDYIERNGPLAPELACQVLRQIVEALDHVHQAGYVHRDIKPSNILLTRKHGRLLAKLADLGLIREARDEEYRLTREGHTVGTVDYLAPEQARDSAAADIRSDIYSLGCTLYHMLTGGPPFADGNLTERLFKHAEVEPPDVRNFNPRIPAELAAICRRMLAKKADDRYQLPVELLGDLVRQETGVGEEHAPAMGAMGRDAIVEPTTEVSLEKPKDSALASPEQRLAAGQF